jgi:polar amino acid transport system substrate-binding protein
MRIFPRRLGIFAAAIWWGLTTSALASGAGDYCSGPVRIALFEFGALYRSSSNDGIDVGLIEELEKRTGCTFELVVRPRARIWKELEAGVLDAATAAVFSAERKAYLYFSPYMRARNVVLVRRAAETANLTDVSLESSGLRLGVVRSFRHEAFYDNLALRMRALGRVTEAADVSELLRLLDKRVVDVVLSQPFVYSQYLSPETLARDYNIYDWAPADEFSVGSLVFSRKRFTAEQAKRWDALVAGMLRDGTIGKIMRQYVSAEQSRELQYNGPRQLD